MASFAWWVLTVQAVYFLITGIWPIVNIRSFLAVTGPKIDIWLVKTVGALITGVGAALATAAWNHRINIEIVVLAIGSAASLGVVDVVYARKRIIAPIYLLDAVAEAVLVVAWVLALARG